MVPRRYEQTLRGLLRRFPVVTVLGPRQCGKTTFIRAALPGWTYLDLERPSDLAPLAADPEARLAQLRSPLILDEAQRLPELFPILRGVVDPAASRRGRLVLLGSASPARVRQIPESLAGRSAFLDLPPFRWDEVAGLRRGPGLAALWFRGGFPVPFLEGSDRARHEWLDAYTRAFIERDLPSLGIDVSAAQMRRLWTMLAHVNGGIWNASQLAASLGVSYHTVNRYVDILEQTFLVRRLPPYHANVGKRLVRSPKLYFRDTGLLHHFLGILEAQALDVHPARGTSWEAFVIDQLLSGFRRVMPGCQGFFWRTAQGDEVDLLVEAAGRLVPFEIKLHSAPRAEDARSLQRCMQDLALRRGYVVYPGREPYSLGPGITALPAGPLLAQPEKLARL
jgi:predicted AAA+ superfamily ATPase